MEHARPKTIVYIDGFNLYYRALKETVYKWLDLGALFQELLPRNDIIGIKYFTARANCVKSGSPSRLMSASAERAPVWSLQIKGSML